jgi:hypothetical protein
MTPSILRHNPDKDERIAWVTLFTLQHPRETE